LNKSFEVNKKFIFDSNNNVVKINEAKIKIKKITRNQEATVKIIYSLNSNNK